MKRPTDAQFDTALMWLTFNEGDNGEAEACKAVAEWLDLELNRRAKQNAVRSVSRKTGRKAADVRAAMQRAATANAKP